jgi:hypothetical protein
VKIIQEVELFLKRRVGVEHTLRNEKAFILLNEHGKGKVVPCA